MATPMPGSSPLLLSITMLAAFALAWGGIVLIRGRRDRRKGVLMLTAALVLLVNVAIWAVPFG